MRIKLKNKKISAAPRGAPLVKKRRTTAIIVIIARSSGFWLIGGLIESIEGGAGWCGKKHKIPTVSGGGEHVVRSDV